VRDWLYVEDHADALLTVLERAQPGRSYNIGGENEARTSTSCAGSARCWTTRRPEGAPHDRLITFVADRPGHDLRYAIDAGAHPHELGWRPRSRWTRGWRAPSTGIWTTRPGGARCNRAPAWANCLGWG
jgi:dTDP-glucose 4,6-dehydratase